MGKGAGAAAGGGALAGAASGALAGASGGIWGMIGGAIWGAFLGAAAGAIGTALADRGGKSRRRGIDFIETTSIRYLPVGVCFGRNRLGGNWISIGIFAITKDNLDDDDGPPGRRIRRIRGVLGLCEGPIQQWGNFRQDGLTLSELRRMEQAPKGYEYVIAQGEAGQGIPEIVTPENGFQDTPLVPWANTAICSVYAIVGEKPRVPEVNVDVVGPDYTIRRGGGTTGPAGEGDEAFYAFYDSFTQSFCYMLSDGSGLAKVPREAGPREITEVPTGSTVVRAWFLGRHDMVVMQDQDDPQYFFIGYWGIEPDSLDWQRQMPGGPSSGYDTPIACWHLDEEHGILHTVHVVDATTRYILRWYLLAGRVERTKIPESGSIEPGSVTCVQYSADLDAYILVQDDALTLIDPISGRRTFQTTAIDTSAALGTCVSGHLVGVLSDGKLEYVDVIREETVPGGPWGSDNTGKTEGALGDILSVQQNSITGHVTVCKPGDGGLVCINFIPSIDEHFFDWNANGTSSMGTYPAPPEDMVEDDFQIPDDPDPVAGWVRDWSWRSPVGYQLTALEGRSSLAAALWNLMVDEPTTDSGRWGGGQPAELFDFSSHEGLHAHNVGGVGYVNPDGSRRYAERNKFDFFLDGEQTVSEVVTQHMLTACQGYRVVIGGKLHVGVYKQGLWPLFHFNESNYTPDRGMQLTIFGQGSGVNQVRMQYRDVLQEYQFQFAEANNEFDQQQRGRTQRATIQVEGVARQGQAEMLAKAVLDQNIGGRRQARFDTHWIGLLVTPTTPVAVTNGQMAFERMRMRVLSVNEDTRTQQVELVTLEHRPSIEAMPTREIPSQPIVVPTESSSSSSGSPECRLGDGPDQRVALYGTEWFNDGSQFPAGPYKICYVDGAWQPKTDGSWDNAVSGWDVVTSLGVVLVGAPALEREAPGWPTAEEAEFENHGECRMFTLNVPGPIGLRRRVFGAGTGSSSSSSSAEGGAPPGYYPPGPGVYDDGTPSLLPRYVICYMDGAENPPTPMHICGTPGGGECPPAGVFGDPGSLPGELGHVYTAILGQFLPESLHHGSTETAEIGLDGSVCWSDSTPPDYCGTEPAFTAEDDPEDLPGQVAVHVTCCDGYWVAIVSFIGAYNAGENVSAIYDTGVPVDSINPPPGPYILNPASITGGNSHGIELPSTITVSG